MIYILEKESFFNYRCDDTGRLICSDRSGTESVILPDISNEFDAVCTSGGEIHFVIQGLKGELIYLSKNNDIWKKYEIFKSRRGIKRIYKLRLCHTEDKLCAFYIMEHNGKLMMIKHRFSKEILFEEPEVVGVCSQKMDYCLLSDDKGRFRLIYRDFNEKYICISYNEDYKYITSTELNFTDNILKLNSIYHMGKAYYAYTAETKSSTALIFCDSQDMEAKKIISFGLTKKCIPELIIYDNALIIQWEEGNSTVQVKSTDGGKSFSKPKLVGCECHFAKLRLPDNDKKLICNKTAIYNFMPYIMDKKVKASNFSEVTRMQKTYKEDIKNPDGGNIVMSKLKEIEADIAALGKTLNEMCEFLEDLKALKKDLSKECKEGIVENYSFKTQDTPSSANLEGKDIGEIDEENLKLFENTDIDSVLVEIQENN